MKLGRKPAVHNRRTMCSAVVLSHHLKALGPPPTACNDYCAAVDAVLNGDWQMEGNDDVGDCTFADSAHGVILQTANAGQIIVPTTQQTLDAYAACTGWNGVINDPSDQGADEVTVCQFMQSTGLCGQLADDWGSIDPSQLDLMKWANQLFGSLRWGVNLPQSAMDQFNAGKPWDDVGDANILGGHDVRQVSYDGSGMFYVITWGKKQAVTPAFIAKYVEETHPELYFDWITIQGIAPQVNLDLNALDADLKAIGPQ